MNIAEQEYQKYIAKFHKLPFYIQIYIFFLVMMNRCGIGIHIAE